MIKNCNSIQYSDSTFTSCAYKTDYLFLKTSKQLVTLTNLKNHDEGLEHFREAMGVMQHHDAVTGTEKQFVADDYARLLYKSISHAEEIISEAIG